MWNQLICEMKHYLQKIFYCSWSGFLRVNPTKPKRRPYTHVLSGGCVYTLNVDTINTTRV